MTEVRPRDAARIARTLVIATRGYEHAGDADTVDSVFTHDQRAEILADAEIVRDVLERFADLRHEIRDSLRRHLRESVGGMPVPGRGDEWLTARIAEDLGL